RFIRYNFARHVASGNVTAWLCYGETRYCVRSLTQHADGFEAECELDVTYTEPNGSTRRGVQVFIVPSLDADHEIGIVPNVTNTQIDALGRLQLA
ncbi:MAG: hypothetical protein ACYTEQ_22715, partial [Planctomycetota bacterium]